MLIDMHKYPGPGAPEPEQKRRHCSRRIRRAGFAGPRTHLAVGKELGLPQPYRRRSADERL